MLDSNYSFPTEVNQAIADSPELVAEYAPKTGSTAYAAKSVETSKLDASQKGIASGVAALDSGSKILEANIPTRLGDTTLTATYGRSINVLSKGAALDGIANDAPAFQAAIDAAATFGLSVYFPPGTARLSSSLNAKSNVTICGEGASSIFTATAEIGSAFGTPTSDLSNFTIRDVAFRGGATDLNQPRRRDRAATNSFTQAIRMLGSGYNGVVPGDATVYPVIKNITIDNVTFLNTKTLPFYFAGITNVKVLNCFIRNCMDPGFVYVNGVDFSHNTVENSADNGVSVSRRCKNVTIANNIIRGTAHYGIWCAGFYSDADGGLQAPGPEDFTITGNKIYDSGKGGIALSDAPKYGVVAANVIDGVTNGNQDYPSINDGTGIYITGYPLPNSTPTDLAKQIIVTGNLLKDCARNGIGIRGAIDCLIDGNMFVDIGVSNFVVDDVAAGVTAGQPVSTTSISYNCGIITSGTGLERLGVINNRFLDTRATPLTNYAIASNVRSTTGFYERGNEMFGYRNPFGQAAQPFGWSNSLGFALRVNAAATQNKDVAFQTAGTDRWIMRMATTNAWQLNRRLSDGSQGSVPISVNWSTGEVTFGDSVILGQGAFLQDGKDLTMGSTVGSKIGGTSAKIGFFGVTPVAKPVVNYSRTGEPESARQLRLALVDLGLITNATVV